MPTGSLAVPVVMRTALGDQTDRLAGFEAGADDYLTEPSGKLDPGGGHRWRPGRGPFRT